MGGHSEKTFWTLTFELKLVQKSGEESSRQRELQGYPTSDPGVERRWALRVEHNYGNKSR